MQTFIRVIETVEEDTIVSLHVRVHDSRRVPCADVECAEAHQPCGIASHLHTIRLRISSHHARHSYPSVSSKPFASF